MTDDKDSGASTGLMPCPFCGGEAAFATVKYGPSTVREQGWLSDTFHFVNCIACGVENKGLRGFASTEQAAQRWNRRTKP